MSLASKDSAPIDVVTDMMTAEERGKQKFIAFVKQRLVEKAVGFHDPLKKHRSKTFTSLYKQQSETSYTFRNARLTENYCKDY